jgi:hypothetical protein
MNSVSGVREAGPAASQESTGGFSRIKINLSTTDHKSILAKLFLPLLV